MPAVMQVEGRDIPEPYRSLLVHERDMTPTLEDACRRSIQLRVLQYTFDHEVFSRQVVLLPEGGQSPVEFGASKIYLEHLPSEARRLVLERRHPLGGILRAQGIAHAGRPGAYIQVTADDVIVSALQLEGPNLLYGRRNVIIDGRRRTLAEVVEILPPWNGTWQAEQDRGRR